MQSKSQLLDECRHLGQLEAWQRNKEMETECIGTTEWSRIRHDRERMDQIILILGQAAWDQFAAGYDETIDFSLNSDWRLEYGGDGNSTWSQL